MSKFKSLWTSVVCLYTILVSTWIFVYARLRLSGVADLEIQLVVVLDPRRFLGVTFPCQPRKFCYTLQHTLLQTAHLLEVAFMVRLSLWSNRCSVGLKVDSGISSTDAACDGRLTSFSFCAASLLHSQESKARSHASQQLSSFSVLW